MEISRQLREIASWRIATELLRRHQTKLALIETHPGGGQYDCLTVITRQLDAKRSPSTLLDLNRVGSLHVHRKLQDEQDDLDSWRDFWEELSSADDPKVLLDRIEREIGLTHHGKPPVSNGEILAYRVISALLSTAAYGRGLSEPAYGHARLECRNGYLDSSGGDSGRVDEYFSEFPVALSWLGETPGMPFDIPEYGFWFLIRDDTPVLCFHVTGRVTDHVGKVHNLVTLYKEIGGILPIAVTVAGSAVGKSRLRPAPSSSASEG